MSRRFGGFIASLSRNGNNNFLSPSPPFQTNQSHLLLGVFLKQHPLDEIHIFRQTSLSNQERITTYRSQLKLFLL